MYCSPFSVSFGSKFVRQTHHHICSGLPFSNVVKAHSKAASVSAQAYDTEGTIKDSTSIPRSNPSSSLDYCVNLVKSRDYVGYLCSLLLPRDVRHVAFAVRAFNVELANIREQIHEHSGTAGVFRLQFWKDTVESIYGDKTSILPRQPVADALRHTVAPPGGRISKRWLMNLIEARQDSLTDKPFENREKFEEFAMKTQGAIMFSILEAMGIFRDADGSKLEKETVEKIYYVGEALAKSLGYMALMKSTAPLASREIVLLPTSILEEFHIQPADVIRGEENEMLRYLFWRLGDLSKNYLVEAESYRFRVPKNVRPAFLVAVAVRRFLLKFADLEANLYDADLQRQDPLLPVRMLFEKILGSY